MHFQFSSIFILFKIYFSYNFPSHFKGVCNTTFLFQLCSLFQQDYFCIYLFEFVMHQLIFLLFLRKREKEEKEARKNTRKGEEKGKETGKGKGEENEEGNLESEGERDGGRELGKRTRKVIGKEERK